MSARDGKLGRLVRAAAVLGLALACALAAGVESRSAEEKTIRLLAKVKSVGADGTIEVGTRAGNCKLETTTATAVVRADGVALPKLNGATAKVLCRFTEGYTDPSNGVRHPPTYSQILAIVSGGPYAAPSDSDTVGVPGGVKWFDGPIHTEDNKGGVSLSSIVLLTGPTRMAWAIQKAKLADVAKDAGLLIEGDLRKEGKIKVLSTTRIVIIEREAPTAEINVVFGPLT